MNQERFEQAHREQWTAFEAMVAPGQSHAQVAEQLPEAYRRICQHLALARDRGYSVGMVGRLNRLVLAGHQTLYGSSLGLGPPWGRFLAGGLAVSVRTLAKPVLLAAALLGLPFAILPVAIARHPGLAYRVVAPQQLAHMEAMYQPRAGRFGQAGQPQIHKPLPPQPHRHGAGRQLRGNRLIAPALSGKDGNPGAAHQLLRSGGSVD